MTPSSLVIVIAVVTFPMGMAGVAVFSSVEDPWRVGLTSWLVRGLVGLAVAHTCIGIYGTVEQLRSFEGEDRAGHAALLSDSLMGMIAYGGILLGLAALVHLLGRRLAEPPAR